MKNKVKILELMRVSKLDHDTQWLKESLQAAIELEFATIPPYLCAMWSIKSGSGPVFRSIRTILLEEMLHMGLACNMLSAIEGTPVLTDPNTLPTYPGPLPGGVNPNLTVSLQGLSKKTISEFMEIEYPESGPVAIAKSPEDVSTIGEFYDAILQAFKKIQPTLLTNRQIRGPLGLKTLSTLDDIKEAIVLIKRQGEGSAISPEDTGPADLAHYYRFAEIFHGRKLKKNTVTNKWEYNGNPIPFPEAWNMAKTPVGGYLKENVSSDVWRLLHNFDQRFTVMMKQLRDAWETGNPQLLFRSIPTMYSLRSPAVRLMQIEIAPGQGNYGPCFRLVI